ncbi:MAG: S-layer homology domain-containing protein [Bacillota bacterium]|nr:S-layer homology domain-containing protein [Bacillota bacterium]
MRQRMMISLVLVGLFTLGYVCPAQGAFSDIYGHWAEQDILKMEARGLIQGDGQGQFFPEELISRQEVVALLVGLIGQQGTASILAGGDTSQTGKATGISDWAKGYMIYASQARIVTPGEWGTVNWSGPAQRQEVAIWLSKALKLLPVVVNNEQVLGRFFDGKQIDLLKAPYIVPLIQDGIFQGSDGYFHPLQPIKRAEVVVLINRADTRYLSGVFQRSQKGTITRYTSWPNPSISIRNDLGQTLTFAVSNETNLYKNGNRATLTGLAVGEPIEFVTDGSSQLIYAEVNGTVAVNPNNSSSYYPSPTTPTSPYSPYAPFAIEEGKIVNINWYTGYVEMEINGEWKRYNLASAMMQEYQNSSSFRSDAPRSGDWAKVTAQNGAAISLRMVEDYESGEDIEVYKGTLSSVDTRRDEIKLRSVYRWSGSSWKYKSSSEDFDIESSTEIYYDGDEIDLDDLEDYEDDKVYVAYLQDSDEVAKVRVIRGYESSYNDDIKDLNRDEFELDNGRDIEFDDSTIFVNDGELADDSDLEEDEEVRVYVDRVGSTYYAALVELDRGSTSSSRDNFTVYRAELDDVDKNDDEIVLESGTIRYLDDDGDWTSVSRGLTMELDNGVDLYYGDDDIDLDDLEDYEGDYIYLVYDEDEDVITHLRVREDSERDWEEAIDSISTSSQRFRLENRNDYIYWGDDTIFLEDDEIFNGDDLDEGDEVVVLVDEDGSRYHAAVVLRL